MTNGWKNDDISYHVNKKVQIMILYRYDLLCHYLRKRWQCKVERKFTI